MGRLLLLFIVVPLLELYLLLALGRWMGFWPTVALVLITATAGASLAKREGLRVLREYQRSVAELRMPEEGVLSAVLVLLGGALLIAPGVLTDVAGILLLIPPTRRVVARWVRGRLERSIQRGTVRVGGFEVHEVHGVHEARTHEPTSQGWARVDRRSPEKVSDAEIVDDSPRLPSS